MSDQRFEIVVMYVVIGLLLLMAIGILTRKKKQDPFVEQMLFEAAPPNESTPVNEGNVDKGMSQMIDGRHVKGPCHSIHDDDLPKTPSGTSIVSGKLPELERRPPQPIFNTGARLASREAEATRLARQQAAITACEINCSSTRDPLLEWMRSPAPTRESSPLRLQNVIASHSEQAILALRDFLAASGSPQLQELLTIRPDLKTEVFVKEFEELYQLLFHTSATETAKFWLGFSSVLQGNQPQ